MTAIDWSALKPILSLQAVLPYVGLSQEAAYHQLREGKFPIRVHDIRPYRFKRSDVEAYYERGEKTNPLLLETQILQHHFGPVVVGRTNATVTLTNVRRRRA